MIPGGLGPNEITVIITVIFLLFGAGKIPQLARSAGKSIGEFKKARKESEIELKELEREVEKRELRTVQKEEPRRAVRTDEVVVRESKSILSGKKVFLLISLLIIAVLMLASYILLGV